MDLVLGTEAWYCREDGVDAARVDVDAAEFDGIVGAPLDPRVARQHVAAATSSGNNSGDIASAVADQR